VARPDIDWVIAEAKRSLCEGVLYEPRAYADFVALPASTGTDVIVPGNDGTIFNSEQFPVHITHFVAALVSPVADERYIQNVRMRIRANDTYYMGREPRPLPLWANEFASIPDYLTPGQSVWHFARPLILSTRDVLDVTAEVTTIAGTPGRRVRVAFQGVGYITERPYTLEGERVYTAAITPAPVDPVAFRNDGSEPIVVHTMIVQVSNVLNALDLVGDTRAGFLQVQQDGNGTNEPWMHGLVTAATPDAEIGVVLLGPDGGRGIVHRLPGDGFVWEPGEGLNLDFLNAAFTPTAIGVSFLGYIAVR
jgi:hypothetical protein